jgi:bifunctional non-homologous end joining protein LigD
MPAFIAPQVPILSPEPPSGSGWIHEIKHDGFRTLIRIDRGQVRALTRGGHDWTHKYQNVVEACRKLSCRPRILAILNYSVAVRP